MTAVRRQGYIYQAAKSIFNLKQYEGFTTREIYELGFIKTKDDIKKLKSRGYIHKIKGMTNEARHSVWRLNFRPPGFFEK